LIKSLADPAPSARIAAAWALAKCGSEDDLREALPVLVDLADYEEKGLYVAQLALTAIDDLDDRAADVAEDLKRLPKQVKQEERRYGYGLKPLIEKTLADLEQ
jgi:hypothetical protein